MIKALLWLEWAVLAVEAVVVAAALVLVVVWIIASVCAWIGEIIRRREER